MSYFVYITTNPKHTVLYTGVTNDLKRRIAEHYNTQGNFQTFAGRYFCYKLVWCQEFASRTEAISIEKRIKGWTRKRKEDLIASLNPEWEEIVP